MNFTKLFNLNIWNNIKTIVNFEKTGILLTYI